MSSVVNSPIPGTKIVYDGAVDPKVQISVEQVASACDKAKHLAKEPAPVGMYPTLGK